ncbi:MAG: UvrB/UvrC motif-containing protein, partial [Patescibacteria group bacterium]
CCGACSDNEYEENVKNVANFLNGKNDIILEYLNSKMQEFSIKKNYEIAAQYRDKIAIVEKISNKQFIRNIDNKSVDIVSVFIYADLACINLFNIRNGVLLGKRNFILKNILKGIVFEDQEKEYEAILIEKFISSYYINSLEPVNVVSGYDIDQSILEINNNILSIKKAVNEKQNSLIELGQKNAMEFINKNQINGKNLERIKER